MPGAAQIISRLSIPHPNLYKTNTRCSHTGSHLSLLLPTEPPKESVVITHRTEKCAEGLELQLEKEKPPETKSGSYTIQSEFVIIVNVTLKELQLYPGDLGRWTNGHSKPKNWARKRFESSLHQTSLCLLFRHRGLTGTCHRVLI